MPLVPERKESVQDHSERAAFEAWLVESGRTHYQGLTRAATWAAWKARAKAESVEGAADESAGKLPKGWAVPRGWDVVKDCGDYVTVRKAESERGVDAEVVATGCGYEGFHFGAVYPDGGCHGSYLHDLDGDGFDPDDHTHPCPNCNAGEFFERVYENAYGVGLSEQEARLDAARLLGACLIYHGMDHAEKEAFIRSRRDDTAGPLIPLPAVPAHNHFIAELAENLEILHDSALTNVGGIVYLKSPRYVIVRELLERAKTLPVEGAHKGEPK